MLKKSIAAMTALSLVASPVLAQSSAGLSAPAPATESVEGSELRGGRILPAIAAVAIILVILALTDTWPFGDGDEPAVSP
jgi:hypothetical protein